MLVVGRVANFEVTIAREVLRPSPSRDTVSDRAAQDLDPRRAIVLEAIAKTNFEIVGQSRYALRVPARNERQTSYFDVRPTHEGPAELWILVRQSGEQLLTLRLSPRVVASRASGAKRLLVPADVIEPPPTASPPINELLIVEQRNGAKASYAYYLNFINPELNNTYRSELEMEPAEYVSRLYKEIESKVIENRADERKLADAMRAFGSGLFDKLFPEPLQRQLWIHRNHIKSVQVVAEEPFIPWELVHLKEPNGRLGKQYYFLAQLGLVRWLKNVPAHTPRLRGRSGRLRYEIPNYEHPDLVLEELAAEAEFLREQLGATAVPARYSTVLSLLKQPGKFDVLHFAGHSEANADNVSGASLLLEGGKTLPEDGFDPERLQASIIEQFANLRGKDDVRPLVVINGCQSGRSERQLTGIGGFAKAFLKAGAGAFVGTLWTISDVPSRHFTEAFYSGLQAGQSITVATVNAREVARAAGDATWLAYVVYAHPWATLGAGA